MQSTVDVATPTQRAPAALSDHRRPRRPTRGIRQIFSFASTHYEVYDLHPNHDARLTTRHDISRHQTQRLPRMTAPNAPHTPRNQVSRQTPGNKTRRLRQTTKATACDCVVYSTCYTWTIRRPSRATSPLDSKLRACHATRCPCPGRFQGLYEGFMGTVL